MLVFTKMTCFLFRFLSKIDLNFFEAKLPQKSNYFWLSATATAQATVIPTIGLLPAPRKPIIGLLS